jgi:hypothetical protein
LVPRVPPSKRSIRQYAAANGVHQTKTEGDCRERWVRRSCRWVYRCASHVEVLHSEYFEIPIHNAVGCTARHTGHPHMMERIVASRKEPSIPSNQRGIKPNMGELVSLQVLRDKFTKGSQSLDLSSIDMPVHLNDRHIQRVTPIAEMNSTLQEWNLFAYKSKVNSFVCNVVHSSIPKISDYHGQGYAQTR